MLMIAAAAARDERLARGAGEPGRRGDVERDDALELGRAIVEQPAV